MTVRYLIQHLQENCLMDAEVYTTTALGERVSLRTYDLLELEPRSFDPLRPLPDHLKCKGNGWPKAEGITILRSHGG